jgi:hypothetical protein
MRARKTQKPAWSRPLTSAAVAVFGAGLVCVSTDALAAPDRITKGPYLQELAATAVSVRAETDDATTATLVVTPVAAGGGADAGGVVTMSDPSDATFHSLRATGLAPKTRYAFTLRTRAGASASGTFTTAPADDSKAPFSFLVYGDNRTDPNAHAAVVREMQKTPSDFLINTGDMVTKGSDVSSWQSFFDIEGAMLRERCVFACVGNHELFDDAAAGHWARYFGPSGDTHTLYYSFRWGDARFFVLNAFEDFGASERAWVDAALTRADAEAGLVWRFVVLHQGLFSSGPHGASKQLVAMGAADLFARHHVDLVLSGHDHIYERGEAKGARYVVTGGGGAPLYPQEKALPSTRKFESVFHFVEATVTPDAVALVVHRADGSILERCGFTHAPGWDCDAPAAAASPSGGASSAPPSPSAATPRCGCSVPGRSASPLAMLACAAALPLTTLFRRRRRPR